MAKEISLEQAKVIRALTKEGDVWVTVLVLADRAQTSERSAYRHLKQLAKIGVAEEIKAHHGYRYRINTKHQAFKAISKACEVFGV